MLVPLPYFEPDKSVFDPAASGSVMNALPSASGWKPFPSLSEISQDLGAECKGGGYVRTSTGTFRLLAATQTAIFELDTTDYSWDDVTGPSGPYTGPSPGDAWTFTVFGDKLLIHNLNDPIQDYDIEAGGVVADLAGAPPNAKYSCVAGDYVVLGHLAGAVGTRQVQWCELNNAEGWTIGENGADFQELPEGNEVQGVLNETGGFTVIQRNGMQYFPFAPSSGFTFTRAVINPKQGTVAPRSIVGIGPGMFFYLSEDGFFGGKDRQPIGAEKVDSWFLSQIDQTYLQDVQGVADPFEKIVWWKYQTPTAEFRLLGYDWQLQRWCTSDLAVGEMLAMVTPATSWDGLDALYASIDAVTEAFDSRLFSGGRPTFATFTTDNKLAYFTGANQEAVFETAQVQPDPVRRALCNGVRVITDAVGVTVEHGVSDYHGATITYAAPASQNRAGLIPLRGDGRLHKFRSTIPAGTEWSVATAIEANFTATGSQ
jgi:hypothetical protein